MNRPRALMAVILAAPLAGAAFSLLAAQSAPVVASVDLKMVAAEIR